jgi:SNF2 family DNA or RNA helicase
MPQIKLKGGKQLIPVDVKLDGDLLVMKFPYNVKLKDAIRDSLDGARWNPDYGKAWTAKFTDRTKFNLRYLFSHKKAEEIPRDSFLSFLNQGNPFNRYRNLTLPVITTDRPIRGYQRECVAHAISTRQCLLAAEMGTGKTLMSIEILEYYIGMLHGQPIWYVSPKTAIPQIKLEYKKWGSRVIPDFMTYEEMTKRLANWDSAAVVPRAVIFDESIKVKNPKAKRSQAAKHLTDAMREEYGEDCIIVAMSGAPATNGPENWWMQCEIVQPGFLLEKNWYKFKERLCIIAEEVSLLTGATFPKTVAYLDDPEKCQVCGRKKIEMDDGLEVDTHFNEEHEWKESKNEVANLFNRLKGLVKVVRKKDCLDLPDKMYRTINAEPPEEMMRVARAMANNATSAAVLLGQLRELSDGFQYKNIESGKKTCEVCKGSGEVMDYTNDDGIIEQFPVSCHICGGTGEEITHTRTAIEVNTPKIPALRDLLDEHEDVGRLVVFGGFQGSVDRIAELCHVRQWAVIKVDGRGWCAEDANAQLIEGTPEDYLTIFQEGYLKYPRICFVGQPGAAGKGLTLTASPTIVFYSNDFNADNRIQAEDRIHRIGMDENRGATIIDLFCLPTDEYVKENLERKIDLLHTSLTGVKEKILGYN